VGSSKKLRENMKKEGMKEPDYPNAAHHTVAHSAKKAKYARKVLKKFGVGINDASNGVFLPTIKGVMESTYHRSLHTKVYYNQVNNLLRNATSKDDVMKILNEIAKNY
jgi:hypothetical protein